MQAWKPLLIAIPAGLLLGIAGGHFAHPVMKERGDDGWLEAMFETRAARDGRTPVAPPQEATYYVGGPSYDPSLKDDRNVTAWQGPDFSDWPEYKPAPMPTIAELEAEVAARDAALERHATAGAATAVADEDPVADAAADARRIANEMNATAANPPTPQVADAAPAPDPAPGTEPRSADGALPAIW